MLSVSNLNFQYGKTKVLHEVSFDIEDNAIVSILGPNGAGKTTLLRCLCNFHRPSEGCMTIDGNNMTDLPIREMAKYIGYVPQRSRASRTTVFDSILIGRRLFIKWSVTKKDIDLVWEIMDALNMRSLDLRFADEISGGEFQKAQIARAIVQEPRVLIMDEPTSNLDIANQHRTMHMICDLVRSKSISTVMTMHDINLAANFSDKLLFMKDGRIVSYGDKWMINEDLVKEVYGIDVDVIEHKGTPFVIPRKEQADACLSKDNGSGRPEA